MQAKFGVLYFCAISLANGYMDSQRGIFSNFFGISKPDDLGVNTNWIGPTDLHDGCEREYPLSPNNSQTLALAGHRYGLVPQVTPYSPPYYLTVCKEKNEQNKIVQIK